MTTWKEQLKEQTRIKRIRMGQDAPEMVPIPSNESVRLALVPLTEAESMQGMIRAATVEAPDNIVGARIREREAMLSDIWLALRDPDNPSERAFDSIREMTETLEPNDIDHMIDQLSILMDYASPTLDGISDEELDNLKKAFVLIDWRGLTGRRWSALRLCLSLLLPELLQVRYSSTISTASSMERNVNDEST